MNLCAIYIANGTGVFILLVLHYVSRTRLRRHQFEDRLYSFVKPFFTGSAAA